jgi:hypothetical protein
MISDSLFRVKGSTAQEAHVSHAVNFLAVVLALLEKGIVTEDELDRAHARALQLMDKELAARGGLLTQELDERYPGVREFLDRILEGRPPLS